jgi:uncharacterized membrane protein YgcG
VTAAVLGGLLALVLAGCSAEGPEPAALDRATGAVLADAADRLADALASDDPCRAVAEADALRERAARALEAGDAPESVVKETTRIVDATTVGLTCEPIPIDDDAEGEDAEVEAAEEERVTPAEEPAPTSDGDATSSGGGSSSGDATSSGGGSSSGGDTSGDDTSSDDTSSDDKSSGGPPEHSNAGGNGGGSSGDRPGRGGDR